MKYALLFFEDREHFARRQTEEAPAYWGAWMAYVSAIEQSGAVVSGAGRRPEAVEAYRRAIGLSADEGVRRFLRERLATLA